MCRRRTRRECSSSIELSLGEPVPHGSTHVKHLPMIIVGRSEVVDVVFIGKELSPSFHFDGDDGFDRRGAHMLQHFERDLRGWRVRVYLAAALHQAQQGWTARLGGGATAQ